MKEIFLLFLLPLDKNKRNDPLNCVKVFGNRRVRFLPQWIFLTTFFFWIPVLDYLLRRLLLGLGFLAFFHAVSYWDLFLVLGF